MSAAPTIAPAEPTATSTKLRHGLPIGWIAVDRDLPAILYTLDCALLAAHYRDADGFAHHWSNALAQLRAIQPEARKIGRPWREVDAA